MTSWADRRSKLSHCDDMTLCWGQLTGPRFLMVLQPIITLAGSHPRSDQQQEVSFLISIIALSSVPQ